MWNAIGQAGLDPLVTAMASNPALAGAAAGRAGTMAGQAFSPLSLLDAPRRAVAGGLMGAMGQRKEEADGTFSTASFLPALAGVAAGGLSALIPGMQGFAPMIGAGAMGLAQGLGEMIDPSSHAQFTSGDVNNALGVPSNMISDTLTGVATDPMTWAGALTGMARGGARSAAASAVPEGQLGAAADHSAEELITMMKAPPPMPAPAAMAAGSPLAPGWLEQGNAASMAGYRDDLLGAMPSFTQPQIAKPYKLMNPAASDALGELGFMNPPTGRGGSLNHPMPPWAEVRGGNVMPSKSVPMPALPATGTGWLNEAASADEAIGSMGGALAGAGDSLSPLQKFLRLRQGTGMGELRA